MKFFGDFVVACVFDTRGSEVRQNPEFVERATAFSRQVAKDIGFWREFVCFGEIPASTQLSKRAEMLLDELLSLKKAILGES